MISDQQKNTLTAAEICNIIRTAGRSSLKKLDYGDLHLEFGQATKEIVGITQPQLDQLAQESPQMTLPIDEENLSNNELSGLDLDHLAVTDPAAWDKYQLEGSDYADEETGQL